MRRTGVILTKMIEKQEATGGEASDETIKKQDGE